jgi:hypothetical protein
MTEKKERRKKTPKSMNEFGLKYHTCNDNMRLLKDAKS